MLDNIIQELARQDFRQEISADQWLLFSKECAQESNAPKKSAFIKNLAIHSGVSEIEIRNAFSALMNSDLTDTERKQIIANFEPIQNACTLKIKTFQEHHALFKTINADALSIARGQWNRFIKCFEEGHRQKLTYSFFLHTISTIQKIRHADNVSKIKSTQPTRGTKRKRPDNDRPTKRVYRPSYVEDQGVNPLIYPANGKEELETQLEESGVRIVSSLNPATPERGYKTLHGTPGGHKVRVFATINGETFFKPLTPLSKKTDENRADVNHVAKSEIIQSCPGFHLRRAVPVEYVATREVIMARSGLPRGRSPRYLMGASAAEIFRAHGIEVKLVDSRSKHGAHLIAHFMADPEEISSPAGYEDIINVIPSTAAANYNTLELAELYIKQKLVDKVTDQIHILVTPVYSRESHIPDLLIYKLTWSEKNNTDELVQHQEIFNITPQSHQRVTKSMHQSVRILREQTSRTCPVLMTNLDELENTSSMTM